MLNNPKFILTQEVVTRNFPSIAGTRVRAGILLISNGKLLLVREKSGNYGPPKGLVDWSIDKSALAAAVRELSVETCVNLKNIPAIICTNLYMYYREHHKELLVYYTVFIRQIPRVHIRKSHIDGYNWVNIEEPLSGRFVCSEASSTLFRAIDNSLLFRLEKTLQKDWTDSTMSLLSLPNDNKDSKDIEDATENPFSVAKR